MQKIGFFGAGMMGSGICQNLLKAGYPLTVIGHRNRRPIEELVALGAKEAPSATALASETDVIIFCVDRAETMEAIVRSIGPVLRSGQFVIDVTTGRPDTSRRVATELKMKGVTYLDAPVVGPPARAAEGTLGALVGAEPEVFEQVKPVLMSYCADAILFGGTGAGITAKLLHNFLTQSTCQVITQVYRSARRNGVDWEKLYNIMLQGAAKSVSLERTIGGALQGNFRAQQFAISNAAKDVDYAGPLLADDPDGVRIHAAVLAALMRPVDAGLGERFVSEMLDPEVEKAAAVHAGPRN